MQPPLLQHRTLSISIAYSASEKSHLVTWSWVWRHLRDVITTTSSTLKHYSTELGLGRVIVDWYRLFPRNKADLSGHIRPICNPAWLLKSPGRLGRRRSLCVWLETYERGGTPAHQRGRLRSTHRSTVGRSRRLHRKTPGIPCQRLQHHSCWKGDRRLPPRSAAAVVVRKHRTLAAICFAAAAAHR
jgi:hypothetical protein